MSLEELQVSIENFSELKAILWCFYPMAILVIVELFARTFDDDDQGGGKMLSALEGIQN